MPQPNERTFVVDTLLVNKITSQTPGAAIQIGSSSFPSAVATASAVGTGVFAPYTLYSYFPTAGTPWLQPSANGAVKILDKFTLPANTLTAGRVLRFSIYGIHTGNNTNVCTPTINIAGTGAIGATITGGTTAVTFNAIIAVVPFFVGLDLFVQAPGTLSRGYGYANGGATAVLLPIDTALTNDWTADQAINLTMNNVTTATDASIYGWSVQVF